VYAPATAAASPESVDANPVTSIHQIAEPFGCYRFLIVFPQHPIETGMKFLLLISNAFINTMGITQPSPEAAKRAAWFIVVMLTAVLAAVAMIAFLAIRWASHS
jgi:hypothetical protein